MKVPTKNKGRMIAAIACFAVAAILLLWLLSERILAARFRSEVQAVYQEAMERVSDEALQEAYRAAQIYNATLADGVELAQVSSDKGEVMQYASLLNLAGNGVMGYVEIPKLGTRLPIYHGTDADVLEYGVGHLIGSSLPVGGADTHTALSGHSGLSSSKIFSDLGKLQTGDRFMLKVLDKTLVYEVNQIRVVEPGDTAPLAIERGMDYCTLITCTPYGINTHRLLVRGVRAENPASLLPGENTPESSEEQMKSAWSKVCIPVLTGTALLTVCLLVRRRTCKGK